MTLYYYVYRSWQDFCRRGENRSWPSVSVESVDSEYLCLNNAFVYAFIMRLTVEERVLRSTFKLNTLYVLLSFPSHCYYSSFFLLFPPSSHSSSYTFLPFLICFILFRSTFMYSFFPFFAIYSSLCSLVSPPFSCDTFCRLMTEMTNVTGNVGGCLHVPAIWNSNSYAF